MHLLMKLLIRHKIREVHEDQALAQHYYIITLQGANLSDTLLIEGLDTHDKQIEERRELVEDLVSIPLNNGNDGHTVWIGLNLNKIIWNQLIFFLQENTNVFA